MRFPVKAAKTHGINETRPPTAWTEAWISRPIARTFALLELVAVNGGVMELSQLAHESGFPLPTIHRLVRTLVDLGYLRQEPSRRYARGPRLLLLADSSETMLNHVAVPHLRGVVEAVGETTNLAMLDGDQVA